jgi:hypothetical protein
MIAILTLLGIALLSAKISQLSPNSQERPRRKQLLEPRAAHEYHYETGAVVRPSNLAEPARIGRNLMPQFDKLVAADPHRVEPARSRRSH